MSRSTKPSGPGKSAVAGLGPARTPNRGRWLPSWLKPLSRWGSRITARIDSLAGNERRRFLTSFLLAVFVNGVVLTALSIFGEVRIWAPNRPSTTINIVFADLTVEPVQPELIEPEAIKDPDPEPEIIEEPELEEEPAPDPTPEEAEPEPDPEPEPIIDLTPEAVAEPLRKEEGNLEAEGADGQGEQESPPIAAGDEGQDPETEQEVADQGDEQSPGEEDLAETVAEEDADLVEAVGADEIGGDEGMDIAEQEGEEEGEVALGEDTPGEDEQELPFDDDFFDQSATRRFIKPRFALPLPGVSLPETALPEGDEAALPGRSGVVAILCPEEFTDEEKQKECAGRPEIRSGWRPGASGEDFSRAARLLRGDRAQGGSGAGGGLRGAPAGGLPTERVFGPDVARRLEREERERLGEQARQGVGGEQDDLAGQADALGNALSRPDVGTGEAVPSWARRDDAPLDRSEIEDLEEALDDAARAQGAE